MISCLLGSKTMHLFLCSQCLQCQSPFKEHHATAQEFSRVLCVTSQGLCGTLVLSLSWVIILITVLFSFKWAKRIVAAEGNLLILDMLWLSVLYLLELVGGLPSLALHSSVHLAKMLIKGKNSSYSYQSQSISSALSVWRI